MTAFAEAVRRRWGGGGNPTALPGSRRSCRCGVTVWRSQEPLVGHACLGCFDPQNLLDTYLSFLRIFFSDFRTSAFTEEDNASGQQQQADDCRLLNAYSKAILDSYSDS